MEILVPAGVIIIVAGGAYLIRNAWREWRRDRAEIEELDDGKPGK